MGAELTDHVTGTPPHAWAADGSDAPDEAGVSVAPWLDARSAAFVRAIVATVARRHPNLRAAILYGSIARHDERGLDDPEPSDVDLLLIFDLESGLERLPFERRRAIFHSVGLAHEQHLDAPREVQVTPVVRDLGDWDDSFVEGVARDGLPLWARGSLPARLAPVAARDPLRPSTLQQPASER